MTKAVVVGSSIYESDVMSRFKNLFSFVPMIWVYEQKGGLGCNYFIENFDVGQIEYQNVAEILSDFDLIIITSKVSEQLIEIINDLKKAKIDLANFPYYVACKNEQTVNINVNFGSDISPMQVNSCIAQVLDNLKSSGYEVNFAISTEEYLKVFSVIESYKYPDFTIKLSFNSKDVDKSYELDNSNYNGIIKLIIQDLKEYARDVVNKERYIKRDILDYGSKDKKNIHVFETSRGKFLFKTCDRSYIKISDDYFKMIEAYETYDIKKLTEDFSYSTLEYFNMLRSWERQKSKEFLALTSSKYVKISNMNDVILSLLGKRRCNLRCKYCFSGHEFEEVTRLSDEEVIKIANHVITGNTEINLHLDNYIGGEPTTDFEDYQRMHYLLTYYHKSCNISTSFGFLTNGLGITKEQLLWLKENNPYVGFSLDGCERVNNKIRVDKTGKGAYKKTVKSIKLLRSMDWPVQIGVSCVVTAQSLNIKRTFLHFIHNMDIHNVVIKPVRASSNKDFALNMSDFHLLKNGYKVLFKYIYKKAKAGDISYLKSMLMPLDYAGRFFIRVFMGDRVIVKRCGAGEHIHSVGNDACIYPCDSFNGVKEMMLADTRKDEQYNNFKVPFVTFDEKLTDCKSCWARYLCGGVCQYVQYVNNYEYNSVIKMECELAKYLIESSINFWIMANEEFSQETLKEIGEHITKIGFKPAKSKYSFFYAPC